MSVPSSRLLSVCVMALVAVAAVAAQSGDAPSLKDPSTLTADAPARYRVLLDTSRGEVVLEVTRDWAPRGAIRFYNLVKNGYYDDARFFRVLSGVAQFGVNGDPEINRVWRGARIIDDLPTQTNERGYLSYAAGGPNTRTTQVFINLQDNRTLDQAGFAPFGRVVSGMNVLGQLYSSYGDSPPRGKGPDQAKIQTEGNAYLLAEFPRLDYIKTARIVEPDAQP